MTSSVPSVGPDHSGNPGRASRSTLRWWAIVFALALLMRGGWGAVQLLRAGDPAVLEFPDEQQYWSMAVSLRFGEGLRDELGFRATRMPLYPSALSLVAGLPHGVIVAKGLQWVVGAFAAMLAAAVATTLFDRRVGIAAGLLVAFDPFLVFFSSLLLTETLFVTALLALWWMLSREVGLCPPSKSDLSTPRSSARAEARSSGQIAGRLRSVRGERRDERPFARWILVGAVAALTVYTRESSLGLSLLALAFVVLVRRFEPRTVAGAAAATAVLVASLVPWAIRNRSVTGEWCWLTTRGGISLYDGVGPQATGVSDLGNVKQMPAVRGMSEVEWNRYFLNESREAIEADPIRVLRLAGVKLARMWNPFPNVETYQSRLARLVSAGWTLPTFVCAATGLILLILRREGEGFRIALFLFLPALYLSVLHGVFIGSVRYRLGAIPMLEILGAVTLVTLIDRARSRHSKREKMLDD